MATTIETDHSPLTTDTTTEDALNGHNHTTDPTMTEAQATTKDMHPAPHPNTRAVDTILQLTDTLGKTHAMKHPTSITVTHLDDDTFHTGVTDKDIPQTKADLAPATLTIPLEDHTQGKQQSCTQEQQPP